MNITTLEEVNQVWACCPCNLPGCGAPRKECESLTGEASVDGHGQFTEPGGDPTDDLPNIYETLEPISGNRYTGTGWVYTSGPGTFPLSGEIIATSTYNWSEIPDEPQVENFSFEGNFHDETSEECGVYDPEPGYIGAIQDPFGVTYTDEAPQDYCNPTERGTETVGTAENGTAPSLQGCPGPFEEDEQATWNFTRKAIEADRLKDPKTKAELKADALEDIPEEWPETPQGEGCEAKYETTWPTIGDIGAWPDCDDGPPAASATTTVVKSRYRFAPSEGFGSETPPRTYYEAQWDEYFFPEDTETDPVLVASRTWLWNGDTEDPWSEWFVMSVPDEPGETRVVNLMVRCWKSTRIGNKPSAFGEVYTPPEA
jgi:hypothetical protein